MFKEFKEFAFKGNLIDVAVGIIIGGAFGTVVKSLVDNVFMPPLGILTSGIDFKAQQTVLKKAEGEAEAVVLKWGQFVSDFIAFALLAFAVFIVVKKVAGALQKQDEKDEEEEELIPRQEVLLQEIRDALRERPAGRE